jgi:glycosyltransferase involved in cell wall biosynthesis
MFNSVIGKRMLSVVIPVHNEADHIRGLLEAFSFFSGLELIVAEDASTDGAQNIVQEFAARNNNVVLSSCDTITGKGAAVKRGLN